MFFLIFGVPLAVFRCYARVFSTFIVLFIHFVSDNFLCSVSCGFALCPGESSVLPIYNGIWGEIWRCGVQKGQNPGFDAYNIAGFRYFSLLPLDPFPAACYSFNR